MSKDSIPIFDTSRFTVETLLAGDPDSPNYLQGVISLTWGKERGQMNAEQARHLAVSLMEAAMVCETDELLVQFLHKRLDLPIEAAIAALRDMRQLRKDWMPGGAPENPGATTNG